VLATSAKGTVRANAQDGRIAPSAWEEDRLLTALGGRERDWAGGG